MPMANLMVFNGPSLPLEQRSLPLPLLKRGEVLIKNKFTTICGSDLHTYCGKRTEPCPSILGHEIVGEIVAIDPRHSGSDQQGHPLKTGDRVTWSIFSSNPESYYAQQGMPQKGEALFKYGHALVKEADAFHGGLSEYCVLKPGTSILKIPDSLPLPIAATINCAIATVAGALRVGGDLKGKNVMILGMGLLGLTCAAMCKDAGAAWVGAADIESARLEESTHFGASDTFLLTADHAAITHTIKEKFSRSGVDIVFDMSGSPEAMETGLDLLAVGGIAVWIGAVFKTRSVQVDAEKIIRGLITIKGLHNYNYDDFAYALDFISRNWNQYAFDKVVAKTFSLAEANEAFEYALQHKPLRVGIRM